MKEWLAGSKQLCESLSLSIQFNSLTSFTHSSFNGWLYLSILDDSVGRLLKRTICDGMLAYGLWYILKTHSTSE